MHGGVASKELNYDISDQSSSTRDLRDILDQLEQDISLLNNPSNIQRIMSLLQVGADPNVKNQDGKTLSYYLNKKLLGILDELEQNIVALSDHGYIQHIIRLLQVGADPNLKNQAGKTSLDYLNEELREIVNWLAININLLDDVNCIQCITSFLHVGADPNVKNQAGKTLSYYSSKRLHDVLNEANNSDLLGNHGYIQHIMFLLQAGANPNLQNQDGKTLLHYVAERNDTGGIKFLLEKGANQNVQDQSGKTPFEYVTEHAMAST